MLDVFIGPIVGILFPRAPAWVSRLIVAALPAVAELVEALDEAKDRSGAERFKFVVTEVSELLDDGLDEIPEWSELDEEQRDRILGGLVELCLFIHRASSTKAKRLNVRRALKKIRKGTT